MSRRAAVEGKGVPRRYQPGERRLAATEVTRSKIVDAARDVLADPATTSFSIDAIAERADVARMTVYYQFKSKGKLLEAVFDDIATRANMSEMRKVMTESRLDRAVEKLIEVFCNLWETQRPIVRRLTALAALDAEVEAALVERGSWRREALTEIAGGSLRKGNSELIELLFVLTGFETYDVLRRRFSARKVCSLLCRAAGAVMAGL